MLFTLLRHSFARLYLLLGIYFIFLMHIYITNNGGNGYALPGNILGVMVMSAVIILSYWQARKFSAVNVSPALGLFTLGAMVLILPLLWSSLPWREVAIPRLLGLVAGLLLYHALLQWSLTRQQRNLLLLLLLAAALGEALLGTAQYWLFAADNRMGYNILLNRPYGIFQQVNVMASFMATGLAIALCLWRQPQSQRLARLQAGSMLFLAPYLLLLIGSRIGLLAVLLVTPLQFYALYRDSPRRASSALLLMGLGIAAALLSLYLQGGGRSLAQLQEVDIRLVAWKTALAMLAEKPIIGWGYGTFQSAFLAFLHDLHPQLSSHYALQHPHNEILYWGVEGGLVALIGLGIVVLGGINSFCLSLHYRKPGFWLRFCGSRWLLLIPILLHTQVELPLYQSAAHGLALILLLRLCETTRRVATPKPVYLLRLAAAGFAGALMLYMVGGMWVNLKLTECERNGLKDVSTLSGVDFPHPQQQRLEWDRHLAELLHYPATKDPLALERYRRWAESKIFVRPEVSLYLNLISISQLQGDEISAESFYLQARKLFPDEPRLTPSP
ncbi:MAG: Wzy polymerase domain-containing protein [Scandinavium sp.]|uniref:PglL family O-oligosaccharyltransferase n=1 Tax=Scandinavium sp. TaxID=2830653 RepID=UPI003F2E70B4